VHIQHPQSVNRFPSSYINPRFLDMLFKPFELSLRARPERNTTSTHNRFG
jgi:hypothetical protein